MRALLLAVLTSAFLFGADASKELTADELSKLLEQKDKVFFLDVAETERDGFFAAAASVSINRCFLCE